MTVPQNLVQTFVQRGSFSFEVFAGSTSYAPGGMGDLGSPATEPNSLASWFSASTVTGIAFQSVNGSGPGTLTLRQNSAPANNAISLASSLSGTFRSSAIDAISAGDSLDVEVAAVTSGSIRIQSLSIIASDNVSGWQSNGIGASGSGTVYLPWGGGSSSDSSFESTQQSKCRVPGSLSGIGACVRTNTSTGSACTIQNRVNSVTGASVSVTAAATGLFTNTASSAVADGDLLNYALVMPTGTNVNLYGVTTLKATSQPGNQVFAGAQGTGSAFTSTASPAYVAATCKISTVITTESSAQSLVVAAAKAQNLGVFIKTNASGSTQTITFRVNATNSSLALSVAPATTGKIEDTTDAVLLAVGDEICNSVSTDATGMTLWRLGFTLTPFPPAGPFPVPRPRFTLTRRSPR